MHEIFTKRIALFCVFVTDYFNYYLALIAAGETAYSEFRVKKADGLTAGDTGAVVTVTRKTPPAMPSTAPAMPCAMSRTGRTALSPNMTSG